MAHFSSVSTPIRALMILILASFHTIAPAFGAGPTSLAKLPVWNFTMNECSQFRNKPELLPYFKVWPEDIADLPFKYCCEYQEDDSSHYNLSNYSYGPNLGALEPLPYYDLGIVDQYVTYWKHWTFWGLPRENYALVIRCDMSDLHRLYVHRFFRYCLARGAKTGAVLVGGLLLVTIVTFPIYWEVKFEELFSDVTHLLLLSLVGSSMMEAIGHSRLRGWRSQIMFNTGVIYSYLTLFAFLSAFGRHCVSPKRRHVQDWRWQKVFGQFAALFLIGAYIGLVDDPSDQALDSFAGIVLAAVAAACIWSSGVEMLVICKMVTPMTQKEKLRASNLSLE